MTDPRRIFPKGLGLPACAVALLLLLNGCDYERYTIIVGDYQLEGIALSDWRDVEKNGDFLRIRPGGRLAIRSEDYTQFLAQFDVQILSGTGIDFYLRTVAHDFDSDNGIRFRYSREGCEVRTEQGKTIPLEYVAENEEETVKLLTEADHIEYSVGCQLLYEGASRLEGTEYVILETLPDTEVELRAINYFDIDELH